MESNIVYEVVDNVKIELTQDKFTIKGQNRDESEKIYRKSITYWQDAFRRFRKNKIALLAGLMFVIIAIMTIVGPMLTPHSYTAINTDIANQGPSLQHYFGTDEMGRDIFARVWVGGRVSILIGIICTIVMALVGSIYGGIAGYYGGVVDNVMMRIVEIISSMPYLVVVILLSLIMGKSIFSLVLAMTAFSWTSTARMVRGQVLQLKEQEYVLSARCLGAGSARIISRHLLPNTLGVIMVDITLSVPGFIFSEAFLSYIGLGIQAPNTSWGALASAAQGQLMFYPYQLFFPCLLISLVMLSFNLMGDGLNDALDPQLRQ